MAMNLPPNNGPSAEMNVTPLIDVLLVLLIIFMIIAPSQGLKTMVPQPPTDAHPQKDDDKAVVLQVLDGGKLKLNSEPITWDTMQMRLTEVFALRFDKVLFVKGDANVDFENVARAIDLAKSAGVDRVGLLTAKIEGGN